MDIYGWIWTFVHLPNENKQHVEMNFGSNYKIKSVIKKKEKLDKINM